MSLGVVLLIPFPTNVFLYMSAELRCENRVLAWLDAAAGNLSYLAVSFLLLLTFCGRETGKMSVGMCKEMDKERREGREGIRRGGGGGGLALLFFLYRNINEF